MAFVQVTPDTKSKKNPDAPPKESTNNESMGEDVNGGGWGRAGVVAIPKYAMRE